MANKFVTFLEHLGHEFKKGLDFILPFAAAAAPALSTINPALGAAFAATVAEVISVEQKFAAMGQQTGSGPQKLATAVTVLEPALKEIFGNYGVQVQTEHVQKYIDAVVQLLNALPAPVEVTGGATVSVTTT